jgi:formylglycine-generating enzyme required for sulfatase activity/dienelactone hydrolase
MTLVSGSKLGPYEILDPLGAGGMGTVYRAHDPRLRRDVAIKVLAPGLLGDDEARRRFRREALALAKLSHPNIATVYDVGEQDGTDYLVMELVPGESLASKLSSGPISVRDALRVASQIAAALEEAHERGVVHRDLKPANVIVTPKGHVKVLDFGIAKLVEPSASTLGLTETRGAIGTPRYMSPEQIAGERVDARTDLWSLGVVLYESLAGAAPFSAPNAMALFSAIATKELEPLRETRPEVPAQVETLVSRALEKNPSSRYQTAAEMARDLSEVLARFDGEPRSARLSATQLSGVAALLVVALGAGYWFYHRVERRTWARTEAIAEIARLDDAGKHIEGFRVLQQAAQYQPADTAIKRLLAEHTDTIAVSSTPLGATVEIQDYATPNGAWYPVGVTPIAHAIVPHGYYRWRVTKTGLGDLVTAPTSRANMRFVLDSALAAPKGMVRVPGGDWGDMIDFVGWVGPYSLPTYYVDRLEVTNRQYQEFVDRGGYSSKQFWKERFVKDGRELSWDDAMRLLRDRTGRPGPSTWQGGRYPDGQADYPVSGVSFYEASAYAAFAGKSLPTFPQWYRAAPPTLAAPVVRQSNIVHAAVAPVGSFNGMGPFGTLDMAGNVREWTQSVVAPESRLILGGAWDSQAYLYEEPLSLLPFDRSPENGIRCVKNVSPLPAAVTTPIKRLDRDFIHFHPASDDVFNAYRVMYEYPKSLPLHTKVDSVPGMDTPDWRVERATVDAAYGGERMALYLFIPKNVKPPFQTVVFFPSASILPISSSEHLGDLQFFDYVVQSGRAVLYPVYQDTYERHMRFELPGTARDLVVGTNRAKDLGRALDYLATRSDIDTSRVGYLGVSMGAAEGVIYATLQQQRLKAALFFDGGYFLFAPPKGGDQADFAPRLELPVLMLNGRYDFTFSLERAQTPLFRMLGTPDADKKHVLLESPHGVNAQRPEMIKAALDWLDKYLGPIR